MRTAKLPIRDYMQMTSRFVLATKWLFSALSRQPFRRGVIRDLGVAFLASRTFGADLCGVPPPLLGDTGTTEARRGSKPRSSSRVA